MKRKKTLSDLTTQLQEAPTFDAPQAETLVQRAAATGTRDAPPRKAVQGPSRFPWLLALLLLILVSSAAPLLLFLGAATVAVPLLLLLMIVGLACWKVCDWIYGKSSNNLGGPR